jgi:hypothetical protein
MYLWSRLLDSYLIFYTISKSQHAWTQLCTGMMALPGTGLKVTTYLNICVCCHVPVNSLSEETQLLIQGQGWLVCMRCESVPPLPWRCLLCIHRELELWRQVPWLGACYIIYTLGCFCLSQFTLSVEKLRQVAAFTELVRASCFE